MHLYKLGETQPLMPNYYAGVYEHIPSSSSLSLNMIQHKTIPLNLSPNRKKEEKGKMLEPAITSPLQQQRTKPANTPAKPPPPVPGVLCPVPGPYHGSGDGCYRGGVWGVCGGWP